MRRIDLRRHPILLVAASGAVDPCGFAAQARAMVGHAYAAPRRGCDLTALDPIRPRLSRDHHRQDCDCVKKLEFRHAFSLYAADPYALYLITRRTFEARYSGARQCIFRIEITVARSGIRGPSFVRIVGNDFELPRR